MSASAFNTSFTSGSNTSYWTSSVPPIQYTPLAENLQTDVVIVGGGMAGISIAYNLCKSGKQVVVVEDGCIGSGETGRTTAHLASALDDRYYDLQRIFGKDGARLAAESHHAAIQFIEDTIHTEHIECDFTRLSGYLFLHPNDNPDALEKEWEALGDTPLKVNKLEAVPGMFNNATPCIEFLDQAQFHPLKYLQGLCKAIERMGGRIYIETRAREIDSTGIVTDDEYTVHAAHVVVATNVPVNDWFVMHAKQFPYRSYVIGAAVTKGRLPKALWWDTGDAKANSSLPPYHYVRLQNFNDEYDLLIVGGEDHMTGHPDSEKLEAADRFNNLEQWAKERFPIEDVKFKWSGQVIEPHDSLGYIGRNPNDKNNVYIATGDSGNGMTHGTIAGMLISSLIRGEQHEWEKLYDPSRLHLLKSGQTLVKELVGGFADYIKHYPRKAGSVHLESIQKEEAAIVEIDKKKYGVYRDSDNQLHIVAAACTHMKCIVNWNKEEKSWDCPCHGSRFTHQGVVVNGPANKDLFYYKEKSS